MGAPFASNKHQGAGLGGLPLFLLPEQSGEHLRQSRLTHDPLRGFLSLLPVKEKPEENTRNHKGDNSVRFNPVRFPDSPRGNDQEVSQ